MATQRPAQRRQHQAAKRNCKARRNQRAFDGFVLEPAQFIDVQILDGGSQVVITSSAEAYGVAEAALQGSIQPDSGWDPYAAATPEPPALYPEGGYVQPYLDGTQPPRQRLLHQVGVEGTYLARFNARGFGVTDAGVYATFAMPFLYNPAPIYLTPGFTYHAWDGPDPAAFVGAPDLPPNAYDAYLDASWKPVITTWFSGDLGVRVGVYSDFDRVNSDSIRIIGRGLGVITFNDRWQAAAGIWYLDRLRVKLLPAGGVIWFRRPRLPDFLDEVRIRGLSLPQGRLDVVLRRYGEDVSVNVVGREGPVSAAVAL